MGTVYALPDQRNGASNLLEVANPIEVRLAIGSLGGSVSLNTEFAASRGPGRCPSRDDAPPTPWNALSMVYGPLRVGMKTVIGCHAGVGTCRRVR